MTTNAPRGDMGSVTQAPPDFQLRDCGICSTPVFISERNVLVLRMTKGRVNGAANNYHESCFDQAREKAWRAALNRSGK